MQNVQTWHGALAYGLFYLPQKSRFGIIQLNGMLCFDGDNGANMNEIVLLGTNGIIVLVTMVFLLGITIGSFLNVCIYRIPNKEDIAVERSHCMHCGHVLKWFELIPLFSFLVQGGKCRSCKKKISWQYPIVEFTNAVLWILILVCNGLQWNTILYCLATSCLIVIFVIDERTKEIPFGCNIFLFVLGLVQMALDYTHWYEYVIGFFAVSVLFWLIVVISKGRAMGGGDVKLMAAAGTLLGWKEILMAMALGCIVGSVIHLIRMRISKKNNELAFGPYLAIGIYVMFLFGDVLAEWYFSMLGL